ncbi:dTDP-glucose 4,6-dehydratase [Chloroflexota bacterium]
MKKLLVTGGAGFIASNFIHHVLGDCDGWHIVNLDKLTYAGNLENLRDVENDSRYRFARGDIADREQVGQLLRDGIDTVVNFAAESHVDRSILDASPFIDTNIRGTQVLLEASREYGVSRFVQVSTDEVYGSVATGLFTEETPLAPNSPYAASKASADLLCRAYHETYGMDVVVTRCSNNYGPFQFPEKLIPLIITNALDDREIPVYGDGLNVRDWIHVQDHCRGLEAVIREGQAGGVYNIGADNECTNLEIVSRILEILGKPQSLITFVKDRLGHDRRYAIDNSKLRRETGWRPASTGAGLQSTVEWYVNNRPWWEKIKSGEYAEYYQRMYTDR